MFDFHYVCFHCKNEDFPLNMNIVNCLPVCFDQEVLGHFPYVLSLFNLSPSYSRSKDKLLDMIIIIVCEKEINGGI